MAEPKYEHATIEASQDEMFTYVAALKGTPPDDVALEAALFKSAANKCLEKALPHFHTLCMRAIFEKPAGSGDCGELEVQLEETEVAAIYRRTRFHGKVLIARKKYGGNYRAHGGYVAEFYLRDTKDATTAIVYAWIGRPGRDPVVWP